MYNIFNMGIGMVIAVDEKDVDEVMSISMQTAKKHTKLVRCN